MEHVRIEEVEDGIVVLTIDRQDRRNALSNKVLAELHEAVDVIGSDPAIRVVFLTGAGAGFSAGADMKGGPEEMQGIGGTPIGAVLESAQNDVVRTFASQEHMAGLFEKIHRLRQPVIAAVNGAAVGGGFAMALACDIRFASESARFGSVFITLGVSSCDMGTSYLLPRLVGASRAAELMLTGRIFDAQEARDMELVLDVVPDGTVVDRALETARQIVAHSPLAVWMTKETMWQTIDAPSFRHALDMENRTQVMCTQTGELSAAAEAFREGRAPEWKPL